MCEECRQYPCHPRCPNAETQTTGDVCESCGEPIVYGVDHYDVNGVLVCEDCVDSLTVRELLHLLGAVKKH